jgi:galactitol PTS system EIIC component
MNISDIITGFGAVVLLPILLAIMVKVFGARWSVAIRSGLLVGIGFIGVWAVFGSYAGVFSPVASKLINVVGVPRPFFDIGDSIICIMGFGVPLAGILAIPTVFLLNYVLYKLKVVSTLNIDLWNYWQFALAGAFVMAMTDNLIYGWLAIISTSLIALAMADWVAPAVEETFNLPGVTITHLHSNSFVIFTIFLNWIFDKIGLGKIKADSDTIRKRFGILGEPLMIGLIMGLVLAIVANYNTLNTLASWQQIANSGIYVAAAMFLLPIMCGVLIQGLTPIGEAIQRRMSRTPGGKSLKIGLDSAIIIGNPAVLASTVLFLPIGIFLMMVLPYNKMLITIGWAFIAFWFPMMVPIMKKNIVKMVAAQALIWILMFYIGSKMSPILTGAYELYAGAPMPEGISVVTSLWATMNIFIDLMVVLPPVGSVIGILIFVIIEILIRKKPERMYTLVGASKDFAKSFISRKYNVESEQISGEQ